MNRRAATALFLTGLLGSGSPAQDTGNILPRPLVFPTYGVNAGILFDRNLNTLNWLGTARVDTTFGSLALRFDDQYNSNTILLEGVSPNKRLQSSRHTLSFEPGWIISERVTFESRWSSLVYSDAQAVGLSSASFNNVLGGLTYTPSPGIRLNPMGGYRWDNQSGFRDSGPSYDLRAFTEPYIYLDDYQLSGDLRFSQDRVDPRLLEDHAARLGMQKQFSGGARDSLEIDFTRTRREFYLLSGPGGSAPVDTSIESRVDDILSVANLLDYDMSRTIATSFFFAVLNRSLDKEIRSIGIASPQTTQFGTEIGEFILNTYLQTMYQSADGSSVLRVRLHYNERNETHAAKPIAGVPDAIFREANENEKTKDNLTRQTTLSGEVRLPLSGTDAFRLSGTAGILRYDTPHILNVEDRDEQLFNLGLTTTHELSQYLDLSFHLNGIMSHIVYLSSQRSANNNINRVLRFAPSMSYRPFEGFITTNTFEVLANYTVYDFEEQAASIRSFSYRQFGWIDSTIVPLSRRLSLDFFVYLRLYERGQLRWDEFTERTENAFADETYAVQIRFVPYPSLTFAAGIRYFSQTRYDIEEGEKSLNSRLISFGPTCLIHWKINRNSLLGFSGWFEERRQSDGARRSLPNLTLNVQITF